MKFNKKINYIILILITLLVLYISLKNDFFSVMKYMLSFNKFWLLISFLLVIAYWFLKSVVIYKNARVFDKNLKFKVALQLMLGTVFLSAVTPFATGGQPYQIYKLKKKGLSIGQGTNVAIQGFIVYQIALVLLGLIAVICNLFFNIFKSVTILKHLVTLGFIINTLVIILLFVVAFFKKSNKWIVKWAIKFLTKIKIIKNPKETHEKWNESIENFHDGAKLLMKNKFDFVIKIVLNFFALCALYLVPLTLLYSTGDFTSYNSFIAVITSAYVMLIGSFVPIPGGTGGLEYGFIAFYGNFIHGSHLTAIMLAWRLITYYFGMIVGAIVINVKEGKK